MGYVRTSLLSAGAVVTYYLFSTWSNVETAKLDTPKAILLTVFVFFGCIAAEQKRKPSS